jgi:uncharacterized membrane protein YwzB
MFQINYIQFKTKEMKGYHVSEALILRFVYLILLIVLSSFILNYLNIKFTNIEDGLLLSISYKL